MSFDFRVFDMSKITTIGGNRYYSVTVFIDNGQHATAVVHATKDEIPEIFDRVHRHQIATGLPSSNLTTHLNTTRSNCVRCSRSKTCMKSCIPTSISSYRIDALRS